MTSTKVFSEIAVRCESGGLMLASDVTAAFLRDIVGWVLLTAGVDKALHIASFTQRLSLNYGAGRVSVWIAAATLCGLEVLIGGALLLGIGGPPVAGGAIFLLAGLTAAAVLSSQRSGGEGCACGGLAELGNARAHLAMNAFLVNAALLSLALDVPWNDVAGLGSGSVPPGAPVSLALALLTLGLLLSGRAGFVLLALRRRWLQLDGQRMA